MRLRSVLTIICGVVFVAMWIFVLPVIASVTLGDFSAKKMPAGVLLEWNTVDEFDTFGFQLLRKGPSDADFGDIEGFDIIKSERTVSYCNSQDKKAISQFDCVNNLMSIGFFHANIGQMEKFDLLESNNTVRYYSFIDREVIRQTDYIKNLTYVYKLQEIDINTNTIDLATVVINPPTSTNTPIPTSNSQQTRIASSTSVDQSNYLSAPSATQRIVSQIPGFRSTQQPLNGEQTPIGLSSTPLATEGFITRELESPTLIPLPKITSNSGEATELAIASISHQEDTLENQKDVGTEWLSGKSILILGFIGMIWIILGGWFIYTFRNMG